MRNWGVAGVVIFVMIASLAQDQHSVRMNGSDLAANCEHFRNCEHHASCGREDLTGSGVCSGYIAGVADAAISSVCVPPDAKNEDIVKATIDWMDVNPSLFNRSADIIVLSALRTHFPCSAPKQQLSSQGAPSNRRLPPAQNLVLASDGPGAMDTIVTMMSGSVLCTMTALSFIELRRIRKNLKSKQRKKSAAHEQSSLRFSTEEHSLTESELELNSIKPRASKFLSLGAKDQLRPEKQRDCFATMYSSDALSKGPQEFTQRPCKATKWGRSRLAEPES